MTVFFTVKLSKIVKLGTFSSESQEWLEELAFMLFYFFYYTPSVLNKLSVIINNSHRNQLKQNQNKCNLFICIYI